MKAFMAFSGDQGDGVLLVYAKTRNKAKYLASRSLYEWEYRYINIKRLPDYDEYSATSKIIEDNDELPDGAPDFYSDMELGYY